jgi:hypothetical protein
VARQPRGRAPVTRGILGAMTLDELLERLTELVDTHEQGKGTRGDDNFDCEACVDCRHCRFCVRCEACDDCTYGEDLFDCLRCTQCKRSVSCVDSSYLEDCRDVRKSKYVVLSVDCEDCTHCLGCVGLHKAEFHVLNRPVTRKEYFATLKQLKEAMEARLVEGWLPDVIGLLADREDDDVAETGDAGDVAEGAAEVGVPVPHAYVDTPVVPWSLSAEPGQGSSPRAVQDDRDDPVAAGRRLIAERAAREDAQREAARRERDDEAARAVAHARSAERGGVRDASLTSAAPSPRRTAAPAEEAGSDDWRISPSTVTDTRRRDGVEAPPTFAREGVDGTGSSPGTRLPGSRSPTLRGAALISPSAGAADGWRREDGEQRDDPWRDAQLPPSGSVGAPDLMDADESEPIDLRDEAALRRAGVAGVGSGTAREREPSGRLTRAARPTAPADEPREDFGPAASSTSLRRGARPSIEEPAPPGRLTRARKPPR